MRNLLAFLCVAVCMTAKKESPDNLPIPQVSLASRWIRQSLTDMTYTNGKLTNTTNIKFNTNDVGFGGPNIVITFNSDLTGVYSEPGINGVGFTYVLSGSQLNCTFNSNPNAPKNLPANYTIKKLTSTQLELQNGTSTGNGDIVDVVYLRLKTN